MTPEEQRDLLAQKMLERHLVANRDEAIALAEKFLEMDVRYDADVPAEVPAQVPIETSASAADPAPQAAAASAVEADTPSSPENAIAESEPEPTEEESVNVPLVGSSLESVENAGEAYAQVLYYENLKLEPSGRSPFTSRVEEAPQHAERSAQQPSENPQRRGNEAMERLQKTKVDLTELFNASKMPNHAQES